MGVPQLFMIECDYNRAGNAVWHAVDEDEQHPERSKQFSSVESFNRLARSWKPLPVRIDKRRKRPDWYRYGMYGCWAVSGAVADALRPAVGTAAEFLPLTCGEKLELFALHVVKTATPAPNCPGASFQDWAEEGIEIEETDETSEVVNATTGEVVDFSVFWGEGTNVVSSSALAFLPASLRTASLFRLPGGENIFATAGIRDLCTRAKMTGIRFVPVPLIEGKRTAKK